MRRGRKRAEQALRVDGESQSRECGDGEKGSEVANVFIAQLPGEEAEFGGGAGRENLHLLPGKLDQTEEDGGHEAEGGERGGGKPFGEGGEG